MPSQKNIHQLEELKQKADQAKSIALADYRGLNVGQITKLRSQVKEAGGELLVAKNTLLKLALKSDQLNQTEALTGPTLVLFANDDEVAPLKAMAEFARENEMPTLKAGFLGKEFLSVDKIIYLSKLPSRQELQARFVSQMAAPLSGLVNLLSGSLRNLVYVLNALKENKEKQSN